MKKKNNLTVPTFIICSWGLVFVVLKLLSVITWNWWVTLPFWGGLTVVIVVLVVVLSISFVISLFY